MTPYQITLPKARRGDTISGVSITNITTQEPNEAPVAVNLTSVNIDVHFINAARAVVKRMSVGNGITLIGTDGFSLDPFAISQTGTFFFDVQFTFPGATVRTWFKGTIEIEDDVTK